MAEYSPDLIWAQFASWMATQIGHNELMSNRVGTIRLG